MRLIKAEKVSGQTTYMIDEITTIELGYIQLGMIMSGQPDIREGEDWKPAPTTTTPVDGAYKGRHGHHASLQGNVHLRCSRGHRPAP